MESASMRSQGASPPKLKLKRGDTEWFNNEFYNPAYTILPQVIPKNFTKFFRFSVTSNL
jgi:hypothetical protein